MTDIIIPPVNVEAPVQMIRETVLEMVDISQLLGFPSSVGNNIQPERFTDVARLMELVNLLGIIDFPTQDQGWSA